MKFSRPAAVFAAVVLLAGGVGVAVNAATTTNPVKLCSNNKTGAVTVPLANGTCAKGTTAITVGSDADILALAKRVDKAEAALAALSTRLGNLEPGDISVYAYVETNGEPAYEVTGTDLLPGSSVVAHYTHDEFGEGESSLSAVDDFGNFAHLFQTGCNISNVYFTGVAEDGSTPVFSEVTATGPGCP